MTLNTMSRLWKKINKYIRPVMTVLLIATLLQIMDPAPRSASAATVVLVGAGDIASCGYTTDTATAKLLDSISGTVFTTGDNVYPNGTYSEYTNCYHPTWGKHKSRTKP